MSPQYQSNKNANAKKKRMSIRATKHVVFKSPVHRAVRRRTSINPWVHSKDTKALEETRTFLESMGLEKTDSPQGSYSVFF